NLGVDETGFEQEMERQRQRARASWKGAAKDLASPVYAEVLKTGRTFFEAYQQTRSDACRVVALLHDGALVDELPAGAKGELVLDHTPFYAEAGGQVGDTGKLLSQESRELVAEVEDTYYPVSGLIAHRITARMPIHIGDLVAAVADAERRDAIRR